MDFDLRLKTLTRLAQSDTQNAERALHRELERATEVLRAVTDYDLLEQNLTILVTIGYRFSNSVVENVVTFIRDVEKRELTYSDQDFLLQRAFDDYRNASSLIVRAIEALMQLRYLETPAVLQVLIELTGHVSESVNRKAFEGLGLLAGYDIDVFYGNEHQPGIGASPQNSIVEALEALTNPRIEENLSAVLELARNILSPEMQKSSWSYQTVTFSRSSTPASPTVADVRLRSIEFLKRTYEVVASVRERLQVIAILTMATRTNSVGKLNEESHALFVRDTQLVLAYFVQLVETEELQIVQKIEHNSYWIFYHAISEEIKTSARGVQQVISTNTEYQIYRILVGFEGVFGDWEEVRRNESDDPGGEDGPRKRRAEEFVDSICEENYAEWRVRILKYLETESDDLATFPVFYHFLETFAAAQPDLALRFISEDSQRIERFLIPLLRGLWQGSRRAVARTLIESWVTDGRYLHPSAKMFLSNHDLDLELLEQLLNRADELDDVQTIRELISVAISNYSEANRGLVGALFLPAISLLTEHDDATWVLNIWFKRETKDVLASLDDQSIDLVLLNLEILEKIDYHTEEVLYLIAQKSPEKVLQLLCKRIYSERQDSNEFEAVPFKLYKLQEPLSTIPATAVQMVRERYDRSDPMFVFRGAHLLKTIFPNYSSEFEAELVELIRTGGDENIGFVLDVLRNYEGELFIHNVSKEIVRSIPADSSFRTEVAIALESTGVVSGEFGMVEAYERKNQEVAAWLTDPNERIREFADWYTDTLETMITAERKRAEENIALRKHHYGEE